jgi:alkanesulfonate monooxygenase SsuD/methylene tetrahydromethanopterin reductase-like flavin-dependent oxidoreductase (luciferase family)
MKYGIDVPNFGPLGQARILADLAADAEKAGWDGFFIWDHIARKREFRDVADPWIALSAIAMQTNRVQIGALVTPLARRRPWKVARETATLDQLSNGRLIFGAGLGSVGGGQVEWENLGEETDLKRRGQMLDEGLAVLAGLWSGQPFSYEGQHFRVKDTEFLPTPLQQPRIPVWIAGMWPHTVPFKRAVRWDGVFPIFEGDVLPQFKALADFLDAIRDDDRPFDVVATGKTPGSDPSQGAEIVSAYEAYGTTWWLEDLEPTYFGDDWKSTWTVDTIRERVLQGPPKTG